MPSRTAVLAIYVTAMCMNGLDATIVNPALFIIGTDLGVGGTATNLVEVAFLTSLSVSMPAAGWLCDRYGAARVFLGALAAFTVASALCGVAWDLGSLVAFRVLQGVGGGLLTPAGMTLLFVTYPPEERMRLSRYIVVPTALAPALGPVLGGLLAEHLSWRWAFLVNVPFGLAAVVLGVVTVGATAPAPETTGRFDLRGLLLAASGFGLLMFGLGEGAVRGWTSPWVVAAPVAGAVLVGLLVRTAPRTASPLLDLGLLADGGFLRGVLTACLSAAGLMGMLFVFPLMYQDGLGASAADAGLVVFPEALGLMAAGFLVDRVCARLGERVVVTAGLLGGGALFAALALGDFGPWTLRAVMFAVGFVLGQAVTVVQISAFAGIGPEVMGRAMTLFQSLRMLGGALGVGVCALALSSGYRAAMLVAAALVLAGAVAEVTRPRDSGPDLPPSRPS
ncbi:DHA2 family efflux MFS transporter permease subunit [Streptosporangium sp. NPDC051022]|uniref:DHA2 family efflux MFS transporter permease subunit n=1 Tax=Streptosporangium sp. NPDC051022 TaxID=3155752 RepID=UPI00341E641E